MPPDTTHDSLLRETVARHFASARIDAEEIDLGFAGLHMSCWVAAVHELGAHKIASLFFLLRGGRIGAAPVFASVSGYGESTEIAIIAGACHWTCAFGPVLRAGLAGEEIPEVHHFDAIADGQQFRVFVDGLDRMALLEPGDARGREAAARKRFSGESWLARAVLESGRLPLLHTDRPTLVSVFVSDGAGPRTVEVKVSGRDWPGLATVFASVGPEPPGAVAMLRELAVAVPIGPAPGLARAPIARTLDGLSRGDEDRAATDWPGWNHHRGELGPALSSEQLATLEARIGALPADYRAFVSEVAAFGAGPGYGLMSPIGELQARIATGTFSWEHETEPRTRAAGALPIAHGGCGVVWLLVIAGPHAGEVWVDACGSDGKVRRVAPTFGAWYRDWLSAAVQNAQPWTQWDSLCCATPKVISQLITAIEDDGTPKEAVHGEVPKRLKPGAMSLLATNSDYFGDKSELNPCQGCVTLAARFELDADVFRRAPESHLDGSGGPGAPRKSWLAKLGDRLRSRSS